MNPVKIAIDLFTELSWSVVSWVHRFLCDFISPFLNHILVSHQNSRLSFSGNIEHFVEYREQTNTDCERNRAHDSRTPTAENGDISARDQYEAVGGIWVIIELG